eukprot:gb/GFBE01061250.1/.p1 GENE.gb/GFBE01061250.1/~~gb/GFBE01061250.1/.p1  ORF type:complete len:427 (+),score=82.92 gb/GFBE01061250.1/:1-1281(+)
MKRLFAAAAAASAQLAFAGNYDTWQLTMLEDAAKEKGAVCLDGTASGYYMEPGTGTGKDKWMVHFQGGGWCTSLELCVGRAQTSLGSSKGYADEKETILAGYDGGAHGLFSNDPKVNPDFHNWNKVYARYCDGGSRAGDVPNPVVVGDSTIYFRGGRILEAMLDDWLGKGLASASDFIVGGCSAGGLTVWLHLDYIRSRVPDSVRVTGVPQCGYFMDLPKYDGTPCYTPQYRTVYEMMGVNASKTMSADCLAAYPSEQWKCFFAQYAMPFIKTPYFAVNSFYDRWQADHIVHSEQRAPLHALRDDMIANLSRAPVSSGYFTYSCVNHCGYLNHDAGWATLTSGGMSLRTAFSRWYFNRSTVRIAEISEEPNQNPTCGSHDADWLQWASSRGHFTKDGTCGGRDEDTWLDWAGLSGHIAADATAILV